MNPLQKTLRSTSSSRAPQGKHSLSETTLRGNAEIMEMTEHIEKNLASLKLDNYDEEDGNSQLLI
jgi:hypothetical protein